MSTGYRSTKAELIAIYRLEFYRKQKSWKLSKDVREQAPRKKTNNGKKILDQTYDVVDPRTDVAARGLNEAFMDSGSDSKVATQTDIPEETSLTKCCTNSTETVPQKPETVSEPDPEVNTPIPELLYQEQEPIMLLIENQDGVHSEAELENKWSDWEHYRQEPEVLPEQTEDWLKTKLYLAARNIWEQSPWNKGLDWETEGCRELEMMRWLDVSYEGCQKGWPVQSQVWTNAGQVMADIDCAADVPVEWDEPDTREEVDSHQLAVLEQWPCPPPAPPRAPPVPPGFSMSWTAPHQEWSPDVGVVMDRSADEFVRGAHAAPHSSELDLRMCPSPVLTRQGAPGGGGGGGARASVADLLSQWTQSLKNDATSPPTPYDVSYEEFPTRDVGLYRPPSTQALADNSYTADIFLAGSFLNHPRFDVGGHTVDPPTSPPPVWDSQCVGRGRGRLRKMDDCMTGLGRGRLHRV